jgi:hypothetical protein
LLHQTGMFWLFSSILICRASYYHLPIKNFQEGQINPINFCDIKCKDFCIDYSLS